MKILYAIQGTGNGHLSRARDIIPLLQKKHDLDILVSGVQADVKLPYKIKYSFNGLSFIFGAKGGIDFLETYNTNYIKSLLAEINTLPIHKYDLVLNDFEPVSAWACYLNEKPCIALSHQVAVLHKKAPQPKEPDLIGKAILKNYAPTTLKYGFHFKAFDNNVFTPVIREEIRNEKTENLDHYTVYLPAYSDERIIKVLGQFENVNWQVYSKHNTKAFTYKSVSIHPINNDAFIKSMATSTGVLCGAGFETPAEALFMNKKLMVIPMKNQYEQQCNATALKEMGVPVLRSLRLKHSDKIAEWLKSKERIKVDYPNETEAIINQIIADYSPHCTKELAPKFKLLNSPLKFQNKILKRFVKEFS